MNEKYTLHSITIENDNEEVIETFNKEEEFESYMCDLNMDLSLIPGGENYFKNIHIYYNVMLSDDEIHGLTEEQFVALKRGEK